MDGTVNQDLDLISPYRQSFAYDDTEQALQSLFIDLFEELFSDQIKNIHDYGMPHLGSATVVERFTKQDGLAVLRRPTSSDVIMRVIYANWLALASRRGLAFLEFVLQMIWQNQWKIERLHHTKDRLNSYPNLATTLPTRNSFLTSRIAITLDQNIDVDEIYEIAPLISKLVPANVVATIRTGLEFGETYPLALAGAFMPYMVGNFQWFDPVEDVVIAWTNWNVLRNYVLTNDTVRYSGYTTNLQQVYTTFANYNIRAAALTAMSNPEYNQLDAVYDAVLVLHPTTVSIEVDTANQRVLASIVDVVDDLAAAQVMVSRVNLSGNSGFVGYSYMQKLFEHLQWFFWNGAINYAVPAHISKRSLLRYTVGATISYIGHLDAAQLHIADMVENNPDWAGSTQSVLQFIAEDGTHAEYAIDYTVFGYAENPTIPDPPLELVDAVTPFDSYTVESIVTVTGVMAAYKARKSNGADMYYATAELDLNPAVMLSLFDVDKQGLPFITGVCDELTGVTDWMFDNANEFLNFISPVTGDPASIAYSAIVTAIVDHLDSVDPAKVAMAEAYMHDLANSIFNADQAKQFVKLADLEPLFDASKVLIAEEYTTTHYPFAVVIENNPDFVSENATSMTPVAQAALNNIFVSIRAEAVADGNNTLLRDLNFAVQSAYQKDNAYPATNTLYGGSLTTVTFSSVVNQIFTNQNGGSLLASVSAKQYLRKVVESIFLANAADQLIKAANLVPQFEANKVLKSIGG